MIGRALWGIIVKNVKLIYRTKASALIILLGPLFIVGIIGAAFNTTGLHSITIATFQKGTSPVTEDLISRLSVSDYKITKFETLDSCIDSVKRSESHICIEFPPNFNPSVEGQANEIVFHLDYSRINLAMIIWDTLSRKVSKKSDELSADFVQQMLETLRSADENIQKSQTSLDTLSSDGEQLNKSIDDLLAQIGAVGNLNQSYNRDQIGYALASTESKITEFQTKLEGFDATIQSVSDSLEAQKSQSVASLNQLSSQLTSSLASLNDLKDSLQQMNSSFCSSPSQQCSDLADALTSIETQQSQVSSLQQQLATSKQQIESIGVNEFDQLSKSITDATFMLNDAQNTIENLKKGLGQADSATSSFQSAQGNATTQIEQVRQMLGNSLLHVSALSISLSSMRTDLSKVTSVDSERILRPIKTILRPVTAEKESFDFLFPSLLTLVIMFIAVLLSATTVLTEKESKAYFRNFISPIPSPFFMVGIFISNLFMVLVQAFVLLIIAHIFFGIDSFTNIPGIIIALMMVSAVFILIGMFIGYLFRTEETATIASISLSIVLLLFSSLVVPIERMTKTLALIASGSPFVLSEELFRHILIFETGVQSALIDVGGLSIFIVILFVAVLLAQKATKRKM